MVVIQKHHIRYPEHPLGEEVVEVTKGEHGILTRLGMMTKFSPGFVQGLFALLPGIWKRILVIGEKKPKDHPPRLSEEGGRKWGKDG